MSSRRSSLNSSTGMPSSRACSSVATEVATQRIPLEAARGDRRQQVGDRRAGSQPDRHPVLDQLGRRLGGEALLGVGVAHRPGLYARSDMDARIWLTGSGGRAPLGGDRGRAHRRRARSRGRHPHRRRGGLLEPPRDREPRRRADGDRPRQPQRHRPQRRAARPAAPAARRRHPDRRRPPARSLRPSTPGRAGATVAAGEPSVALTEEERATAAALVAPYRSEGAFAGRPATRAEIAAELHVSERTAQRRLDALAAKLDVPGDAGRERPRLVAARVIELGLDRSR